MPSLWMSLMDLLHLGTSDQRLVLEADLIENLSALVGSRTPRRKTL
jgi:hypothetical protein